MDLLARIGRFVQSLDPSVVSTAMWLILLLLLLITFGRKASRLLDAVIQRVKGGSAIEIWKVKIEAAAVPVGLESMGPQRSPVQGLLEHPDTPEKRSWWSRARRQGGKHVKLAARGDLPEWTLGRRNIGVDQRGVHLAHLLAPTREPGQEWEIFIYLVAGAERTAAYGMPGDVSDVASAEFYLGHMWGERTTTVTWTRDRSHLGIRTTAYAPVICLCRITFRDGHTAVLSRFIDFEMGRLFHVEDA